MKSRDVIILKKIIQHSNEIKETIIFFELDFEKFTNIHIAKNAIVLCILQIGELAVKLTDEFKLKYKRISWREIIAVRNKAVHAYESVDMKLLWEIALEDVPKLKDYCVEILNEIDV